MRIYLMLVIVILMLTTGLVGAQDEIYEDPQGRFVFPIPTNWSLEDTETYVKLLSPEGTIKLHFLVMPLQDDVSKAITDTWLDVNPVFDVEPDRTYEPPSQPPIKSTLVVDYKLENEKFHQALARTVGEEIYVLMIEGPLVDIERRNAQLRIIFGGYEIAGKQDSSLINRKPQAIDTEITQSLDNYINELMPQFQIPGAVVAVVQNGEMVYSYAYGVRELGNSQPMTTDTHMMIGSTGKALTTTMMAALVDDGLMNWDTRAVDILPWFEMGDTELTQQIVMSNLVCACSGVPRRDFEFLFNGHDISAEDVVESLATFELFTDFGEAFQYSNQMVASGGYIASATVADNEENLMDAYTATLQSLVLDPTDMPLTTLSFNKVTARGEYATPHGLHPGFIYKPLPLAVEETLVPVAPAGSHWSTAEDMANFLIMQLNNGVAVNGTRVVSEQNLMVTRSPQVQMSATSFYGLGWTINEYKGMPMIQHNGNTLGFTTDLSFLPDANVGVVVLTNARASNSFNSAIRNRLFDLMFDDVNVEADGEALNFALNTMRGQLEIPENVRPHVNADVVQSYTGKYLNDDLGEVTFELEDGEFIMDTGEFHTAILPIMDTEVPDMIAYYVAAEPPVAGLQIRFQEAEDNSIHIVMGGGVTAYRFTPAP